METSKELIIPTMYTLKEASKATGIPIYRIRVWATSGEIISVKCGKKILVNMQSIISLLSGTRMELRN